MKITVILAMVVIFALSALWKRQPSTFTYKSGLPTPQNEDPTSLRARVKKAKAQGATEVVFPAPTPYLADVSNLDNALTSFSVIVATPLNAESIQVDDQNIVTYYRFRILEKLHDIKIASPLVPENVPNPLGPLAADEIYIIEGGGTVTIDGTKVTQKGSHEYFQSKKYLLFISTNLAESLAIVSLGKYGVFKVKGDDDTIEGIVEKASLLSRDLTERQLNKVTKLRYALKKK